MREFKHETIIVDSDGWKFLLNQHRVDRGFKPLSQSQTDRAWNKKTYRNNGANPETHPISDNEIRLSFYSFGYRIEKIISLLNEKGFNYRQDGYVIEGIDL